jgi:hypothetical protein
MQFLYLGYCIEQFTERVAIPCWLYYNATPGQLWKQASSGDNEALEKLLRLDKSIVADGQIAERWHRIMVSGGPLRERLLKTLSDQPWRGLDRARLKGLIGAFVALLADAMGEPLGAEELRSLFDKTAARYHKTRIDVDLPGTPDAFYQRVRRERKAILDALGYTLDEWRALATSEGG